MIKGRTGLVQPCDTQEMSTDESVWTLSSVTCCTARYRWSSETNRRTLIDLKKKKSPSMLQGCWIILNIAVQSVDWKCCYEPHIRFKVMIWSFLFCLQWLRALHSSRQSFNIVFGECPYCSKVCVCLTVWLTAAFRKPSIDIQLIN